MFKFLIEGKTIKELKANIEEFFNEFESLQPGTGGGEEQDFLTQAAAQEPAPIVPAVPATPIATLTSVPSVPVSIPKENGSATPAAAIDSRGFPWDDRIHASSRTTNKDGTWRYKRGVEQPTINTVEQELITKVKGQQAAEMQPAPVAIPTVPGVPAAVPVAPPPIPQETVLPNAHTVETFTKNLIPVLAKLVKEGKLDQAYINSLKAHYGVDEIYKVNATQAAELFQLFVQHQLIQSV